MMAMFFTILGVGTTTLWFMRVLKKLEGRA